MSRARILVVEDEGVIALDIEHHLTSFGYDVVGIANSGARAIEKCSELRPDLVLMDIVIKGRMDGIQTAAQMRSRQDVPVVFLTAHSDRLTVERAGEAAPHGYLLKPFRPDELRAAIEVALVKHRMERKVRESRQWLEKTLHCIGDGVIATDQGGCIRFMNPSAESTLGRSRHDVIGLTLKEVFAPRDERSGALLADPVETALRTREVATLERDAIVVRPDGRTVPVDDSAAPILDDDGSVMGAVLVFRDITDRRNADQALRESEERFHSAFEHAAIGMALVSLQGQFLQVNESASRILGHSREQLLQGNLLAAGHPEDASGLREDMHLIWNGRMPTVQVEQRFPGRDGAMVWTQLSVSPVRDAHARPLYFIVQIQDITARKNAEAQLAHLANHDPLTGLPNRNALSELLANAISSSERHRHRLAVVFLDLDGFKLVNDTLGHDAGDHLLRVISERLRSQLRGSDLVARLGGDEFVLVLPEISHAEDAGRVVQKCIRTIAAPVDHDGHELSVSASAGISVYPEDGANVQALLVNADNAMYRAKELGKNTYQYYRPEMTTRAVERLTLERDLRRALGAGEFELHYQPIVERGRFVAMEALLRWRTATGRLAEPGDFVSTAEESGLIVPIGEWVLRTACGQAKQWRDTSAPELRIAVNLSAKQFQAPDFLAMTRSILDETGLPPAALDLEITESSILRDVDHAADTLRQLGALGVRVWIDDFGTGYSSLNYLRRLPLHGLKIDRSFVAGAPGNGDDAAIVRAIIALAHSMRLNVVGEGVETESQSEFLLSHGCETMQGYLFSRPLPMSRVGDALENSSHVLAA